MQTLSQEEFQELTKDAKVLRVHPRRGDVVYLTPEQKILKLYHRKSHSYCRHLTHTHTQRVLRNYKKLQKRNIDCMQPSEVYRYIDRSFDVVIYNFKPGTTVRDLLKQGDVSVLDELAVYIAMLHNHNIYFQDGHMGNYLVTTAQQFYLLDIHFMKFRIDLRRRAKNLVFLLTHHDDVEDMLRFGLQRFIDHYLAAAKLSSWKRYIVLAYLRRYLRQRLQTFTGEIEQNLEKQITGLGLTINSLDEANNFSKR